MRAKDIYIYIDTDRKRERERERERDVAGGRKRDKAGEYTLIGSEGDTACKCAYSAGARSTTDTVKTASELHRAEPTDPIS